MTGEQWAMTAWHPSSAAQHAREARVKAIWDRLPVLAHELEPSFLPGVVLTQVMAERDALWLELAELGEFPYLVRKDGPARYARKAR
jgi:hypothetical protein